MNRKQRRAQEKMMGKENSQKLAEKISQFDQLPDECLACLKPFDNKSKEMAQTWNVVVRDESIVRLYCPECWEMAHHIIEEFKRERGGSDDS
jgi:ribosomal protein L44E|tara:strand:+ start:188 stop:463 length:276 start_codon:yes stop_codon:yes gene_type:complete